VTFVSTHGAITNRASSDLPPISGKYISDATHGIAEISPGASARNGTLAWYSLPHMRPMKKTAFSSRSSRFAHQSYPFRFHSILSTSNPDGR
jgi:hypothetical protein